MRKASSSRIFYLVEMSLNKLNNVNSLATFFEPSNAVWFTSEICLLNVSIHHHHTYPIYVNKISIQANKGTCKFKWAPRNEYASK